MPTFEREWTLESGPKDAPHSVDVTVEFRYSWGSPDSYWSPGDPDECEVEEVWFPDPDDPYGVVKLSFTAAEEEKFQTWVFENPPEPDYEDYYD